MFKEMFKYQEVKKLFYLNLILFFASLLLGYFLSKADVQGSAKAFGADFGFAKFLQNMPDFWIFVFIFINNSIKAFLAIYLGIFFGLFPLYFIASNGYIVGMVLAITAPENGIKFFMAGILPHGVFEMFAVLYASSLGAYLGYKYFRRMRFKENTEFKEALGYVWDNYKKYVIPILLGAALIETYVTKWVLSKVG